jgi:hypothetical protein
VIDEQAAHDARRNPEEVGATLTPDPVLPDEFEIRLVDERRRLERLRTMLPAQVVRSQPSQLVVDQRKQLVEGVTAAGAPFVKEARDRQGGLWHQSHHQDATPRRLRLTGKSDRIVRESGAISRMYQSKCLGLPVSAAEMD